MTAKRRESETRHKSRDLNERCLDKVNLFYAVVSFSLRNVKKYKTS